MRPRGRGATCCVSALLCLAGLVGGGAASASDPGPAGVGPRTIASLGFWVDPASAAAGADLNAVAAVAPDDVWAVGATYDGRHGTPLMQHWDGRAWSTVTGPEMRGVLTAISVVGPDDIWAAGYRGESSHEVSLIEHWDGSAWSVPDFAPFRGVYLTGVAALSGGRVVAVGIRTLDGYLIRGSATIRLTRDAAQLQQNPNPSGYWKVLSAIALSSPTAGWRVAELLPKHGYAAPASAEHWNGRRWVSAPPASAGEVTALNAVTIVRPGDVWAVGAKLSEVGGWESKLVERWTDGHWVVVSTPNLHAHSSSLNGVSATSDHDVWVVGRAEHNRRTQSLTMHWDGVTWQAYTTPDRGVTPGLSGVTSGRHQTWAVGSDLEGPSSYCDFWNGHAWVAR